MMRTLLLIAAALLALLFNLEWTWRPKPHSVLRFPGPDLGLFLCAGLVLGLLHQAFLDLQMLLIDRGRLSGRIRTPFDRLPVLLLIPLMLGGSFRWTGASTT
jgi:hypothetical protein